VNKTESVTVKFFDLL